MKTVILLILLNLAFTAEAQTVQRDSTSKTPCKCYLAKDPQSAQLNPYWFADSPKVKKTVKAKKKTVK